MGSHCVQTFPKHSFSYHCSTTNKFDNICCEKLIDLVTFLSLRAISTNSLALFQIQATRNIPLLPVKGRRGRSRTNPPTNFSNNSVQLSTRSGFLSTFPVYLKSSRNQTSFVYKNMHFLAKNHTSTEVKGQNFNICT